MDVAAESAPKGSVPDQEAAFVPSAPRPAVPSWLVLVATVAAAVPPVVAALRAVADGWLPAGDDSYALIGARDVFTAHPPLLGYWSSASDYLGLNVNHPGPLLYFVLALPVKLLGAGPGVALGIGLLNAACVVASVWFARRIGGNTMALLTAAFLASLVFTIGSGLLFDPWTQHVPMLPFALMLVASWAAATGDDLGLPVALATGCLALETHLSYVLLVPALLLFGLAARLLVGLADRRHEPDRWRARRRRAAWSFGLTVVLGLALWAPPLYEQATRHPGNLTLLERASRVPAPATPTPRATLLVVAGSIAQPPLWLPPSFTSPNYHPDSSGRPLWENLLSLGVLAAVLAGLAWSAKRRRDRVTLAGIATVVVGVGAGIPTILDMPLRPALVPTYLRWMWPFSMFVWLVVAGALVREVRARRPSSASPSWARGSALLVAGVAVVFGGVACRTVDNGNASPPWAVAAGKAMSTAAVSAVRGHGTVLVVPTATPAAGAVMPMVMASFQQHAVPFVVDDPALVRQLGASRDASHRRPALRLVVTNWGRDSTVPAGLRLVASRSGLTLAEADELDRVQARLVERMRQLRGLPLASSLADFPPSYRAQIRSWQAQVSADPATAISEHRLLALNAIGRFLDRPILDVDRLGRADVARYLTLQERSTRGVAVLVGPAR